VLRELAERARSVLRSEDIIGRFGGEEFLALLPETDTPEARAVAERLRSAVAATPLACSEIEHGIAITVSIGVASCPADGTTPNGIQEQVDQAMYWAKRLGRNRVCTVAEATLANCDEQLKTATAHMLQRQELTVLDTYHPEQHLWAAQLGLIYALMGALDTREPGMNKHAHEMSDLVTALARALHLGEERTLRAATAAFLHDIGRIALPDRLTWQLEQYMPVQQRSLLQQHAELGATIVEASLWLSELAPAIRHQCEWWDGTGVPDGLRGEAIPLEARLIALAGTYHAFLHEPGAARSVAEALAEVESRSGTVKGATRVSTKHLAPSAW
jgi:response regulator RpfG family c-di-GMP phosphodiesterase